MRLPAGAERTAISFLSRRDHRSTCNFKAFVRFLVALLQHGNGVDQITRSELLKRSFYFIDYASNEVLNRSKNYGYTAKNCRINSVILKVSSNVRFVKYKKQQTVRSPITRFLIAFTFVYESLGTVQIPLKRADNIHSAYRFRVSHNSQPRY